MTDSTDNTNKLDDYGVWVKRSPESDSNIDDDFNFDAELPDFSDFDSSLSFDNDAENNNGIPSDVSIEDFLNDNTSELSVPDNTLDDITAFDSDINIEDEQTDFLGVSKDVDFADSFYNDNKNSEQDDVTSDVNLDDIPDTLDETFSLDDNIEVPEEVQDAVSTESTDGITEEVDLADFGVDFSDDNSSVETSVPETSETHEDYELSVFSDDDINPQISEKADSDTKEEDDNVTEEISTVTETENTNYQSVSNELLEQIVSDLSNLKNEISDLKEEFAQLKSNGASSSSNQDSKAGGFFSDIDEDETISLSGDELDNIMNTADFSNDEHKEEAEEKTNQVISFDQYEEIPVQNSEEQKIEQLETIDDLEEVKIDDSIEDAVSDTPFNEDEELYEEEIASELPDEIAIPKVDDILADDISESSSELVDGENIDTAQILDITSQADNSFDSDSFFKTEINDSDNFSDSNNIENNQTTTTNAIPSDLREEIKSVLLYMDQLLEDLPEEKIVEFARSEQFATYKKLFADLGLF